MFVSIIGIKGTQSLEMVNPRALKLFHIIADKGSLAAASVQFNLSPPAASRLVSLLEAELGFDLFSREGRNLTLTQNGFRFLRESQPILQNFESIERVARDIKSNASSALRVLSTAPISTSWIAPALGRLGTKYPSLGCTVEIVDRHGLQASVGNRSHDIAVSSLPVGSRSSRLVAQHLCSFRLEAVFHKCHPLASKTEVSATDIAAFPVIALYQGQIGRVRLDEFFQAQGMEIVPRFETSSSIVSLSLCRQNLGVALVPSVYLHGIADAELAGRPLNPERWIAFGAVTAEGQKLSEIQRDFLSDLKATAGEWPGTRLDES